MKNLVFAIDVDDVLRDSLHTMIKLYNEEFNDNKKYEDIVSYDVEEMFPRIFAETGITAREWFFDCHGADIFVRSKPLKGARKAIETLKRYGTVVIVTRQRTCENKIDTIEWLCKNKMICDDICFLKDKQLFHCDYLIDDYVNNFINANAKNAVLINAPHNNKGTDANGNDKSILEILNSSATIMTAQRCNSLESFVSDFLEELNNKEDNYGN